MSRGETILQSKLSTIILLGFFLLLYNITHKRDVVVSPKTYRRKQQFYDFSVNRRYHASQVIMSSF